jgi:hypothetical protein
MAFTTPNFMSKEDSETNAPADAANKYKRSNKIEGEVKPPPKEPSGLSIEADAKVNKIRKEILTNNTITISVSWTGGGQGLKTCECNSIFIQQVVDYGCFS